MGFWGPDMWRPDAKTRTLEKFNETWELVWGIVQIAKIALFIVLADSENELKLQPIFQ